MRIGFDAKRLFMNDRGLGNYARNLLGGLTRYQPGNDYFLYTPTESNKLVSKEITGSSNVSIRLPKGLLKRFGSIWRSFGLGSAAALDNLDIYHGLSLEIPYDIKRASAKVVVTVHDLIFVRHPEFYKPIDRWLYYKKLKYAVNHADIVVAISDQTSNDILEEFKVDGDKVKVVYQSCNEVYYEQRTKEELSYIKEKAQLPDNYLLFVGALNENKNIMIILEAMNVLGDQLNKQLVVVGKGSQYKKKLLSYANENGLSNRLHFVNDYIDPTPLELSCIYQMASMFILPSFYEGFGIPILEARFSGIPVLASNSSCLEEAGGEVSLYFDPNDANQLAQLIGQLETGDLVCDTSPPMDFHAKQLTNQMMNLYKSLL